MTPIAFNCLLSECQLMKVLYNKDYIAEIKEEIVEFNDSSLDIVFGVCAIIEQAVNDLSKFCQIWNDNQSSMELQEKFSAEKMLYFGLKALETINYLH